MQSTTTAPSPGNRELRRYLRDLAALTALPAVWSGADCRQLAESLADVVVKLFYPDFVCVRLKGSRSQEPLEVVRTREGADILDWERVIGAGLEPCLPCDTTNASVVSLPHPIADSQVRAAVIPIGYSCELGMLIAAGGQPGFPSEEDRLLLGVAANQAAIVLQRQSADETRALLAAIIESSQDAIVSKTLDGIITSWNQGAERLFEYTAAEAVGKSITFIIPEERRDEEIMILSRLRRGERIEHFETVRRSKTGRLIDISLTISPIRDSRGRLIGASKVARDITAWKNSEEALKDANRRKDEFLAMLAHELRNPLAPILNAVQVLRARTPPVSDLQWARDVIDRQANQMTRLVDDLLDVARITQGKIVLRKERVDLSAVVSVAVEGARPLIEKKGHVLMVKLPAGLMALEADRTRLAQVLTNLLNNAAKYTEEGGRIGLTVEVQAEQVLVKVKDSGIGIPREMQPRVFEMFTQVDHSLERAQGGLGLGLTLAQRLAEMHGGTITAHSDGPGKGSEFVLRLPLAARVEEPAPSSAHADSQASTAAGGTRILVVDDNQDAAESLAMLLRMIGHEVHTARDGLEAVEAAMARRPDVVLLDIGLPKLNGYEAARRIRQERGEGVTLIALTGWGQEEDRRQSRDVGFDHHLTKPVDFIALQKLLAALVAGGGRW
jgi:PAS domain S-box-containing protein